CLTIQSCRRRFDRRFWRVRPVKVAFTALLLVLQAGLISVQAQQLALASTESGNSAAYSHLAAQAKEFGEACVNIDVERALQLTWPRYVERYGRDRLAA